jgi:hypothetical protein
VTTQSEIPMFKVEFKNPKTGKGYIDGFRTAKRARKAVEAINRLFLLNGKGYMATYIGRPFYVRSNDEI